MQETQMQDEIVDVVDPIEARRWLGVSAPVFGALWKSGLLGRVTTGGDIYWEDLQHYNRYGTQWLIGDRPGLPQRM